MSKISGGQCTSLNGSYKYPDGSSISAVGGLPFNNDGGCHWDDEGTNGNYAHSTGPGKGESNFAMCGPQWGSWQDSQKPNTHGNKAEPVVSHDGDDARRGTLIPMDGESLRGRDADMWSLCCDGTDYNGDSCPRSGASCNL